MFFSLKLYDYYLQLMFYVLFFYFLTLALMFNYQWMFGNIFFMAEGFEVREEAIELKYGNGDLLNMRAYGLNYR